MTMKRSREDEKVVEALAMANYMTLLSQIRKISRQPPVDDRVFECKTCNKKFTSFQALGGHRTSHKRPKLMMVDEQDMEVKPKIHKCSMCGMEFALGQALGGHMRRHRSAMENSIIGNSTSNDTNTSNSDLVKVAPVSKKSNSCKGDYLCLDLKLGLGW